MWVFDHDFLIDGKPILAPDQGVEITETDLDSEDSGRDEGGFMHREVVREGVPTITFCYSFLNQEQMRYMKSLFKGKKEFTVSYLDDDGQQAQMTAYSCKRTYALHYLRIRIYKNLKFSIIG